MLLNDIGNSPDATFRKINQHLATNYGFKIAEDAGDRDLVAIMEQISDEVTDLKIKGETSKNSPEISKRLLVLEGIKHLREFVQGQFQSPKLNTVVSNLTDFVVDTFEISGMSQGDFEAAVHSAMNEYRSSRYRFPDDYIEQKVRHAAMTRIHNEGMADVVAENRNKEKSEFVANKSLASRAGADRPQAGPAVPMVKDKEGRMVPDPFAMQAAARRAGRVGLGESTQTKRKG